MRLTEILLIILIALVLFNLLFNLLRKNSNSGLTTQTEVRDTLLKLDNNLIRLENSIKGEFQRNREENQYLAQQGRTELAKNLQNFGTLNIRNTKDMNDLIRQKFSDFDQQQVELNAKSLEQLKEIREAIEKQLIFIREDNASQLSEIRKTVDEKLQKTINERLSQSFETVGKQLIRVQEGLGEMKTLAADVGGLKRVLSNVKLRGNLGEIQLSLLLEQILAPEQYAANVITHPDSSEIVEFAIKLPGKDLEIQNIWLPIDAKFPKDVYEQLQNTYEEGDQEKIVQTQKELTKTIKRMAKDIHDKYIAPPYTTNFGILFLPFEGIYAEVVRNAVLLEELQRDFQIIVTGPTTLAALLNSLQIGFRTLAIQKRSSEVWKILGAVKNEFEKFGGLMQKAQKNIQTGLNQLDEISGTRTKVIENKLRKITKLEDEDTQKIFPELNSKDEV